jgi:hypothetical protein
LISVIEKLNNIKKSSFYINKKVLMNNFTNPIFNEFINLKIINKKKIIKISNYTRDKKISVYKDKSSGVIFLQKCITSLKYYKLVKYKSNYIPKKYK